LDARLAIFWAGLAGALIALAFVFLPVTTDVGVDCGSAFGGGVSSEDEYRYGGPLDWDSAVESCKGARISRWQYVAPMLALGVLGMAYGGSAVGTPAGPTRSAGAADDETESQA
jgi:hypothetical protein